jgi:hypothetical protein
MTARAKKSQKAKKDDALVVAEDTAMEAYDYGDDAGVGDEDQTNDDLIIPILVVLQKNSPQVDPGDEKYVEGAKPGMFLNTVTGNMYETIEAVAVATERTFNKWKPRDEGGGLLGRFKATDQAVIDAMEASTAFGKYETEDGMELIETFNVYWLLLSGDDTGLPALSAFTSTKITPYKKWNTARSMFRIGGKKPPIFAHRVILSTVRQENSKGAYYNVKFTPAEGKIKNSLLSPQDDILQFAKELRKNVKTGAAKVDFESEKVGSGGAAGDEDEDIPF